MSKQNSKDVARVVQQYLQDAHPGGATLAVVEAKIRKEGTYWHVPIRPSVEPPKLFEYYEALADIESAIDTQEHLKVILIPGDPQEAQAA